MLKGIDPIITPELLKVLAEMGHGDEIVVADANFTAASLGAGKPLLHLAGVGVARAVEAVMSLLPVDQDVTHPVAYMQVSHQPDGWRSALQRHVISQLTEQGYALENQIAAVERFAFYERVKQAYAIVLTSELQPYGNFIVKKGVICEPLAG
ncbi:RbsD/FucU family protein [Chitinibacter sp. S2-10]|uniref:RbsD/FucU family protein n=1 Tax=Chitinibacter sp. S2-10 TaxID=3373597 RepID=UPI0039776561